MSEKHCPVMTTSAGAPVADNQHSLTAGERGPILLQDYQLIEKLAHQNRGRIPERVVHAKGWGAYGGPMAAISSQFCWSSKPSLLTRNARLGLIVHTHSFRPPQQNGATIAWAGFRKNL